MAHEGNSLFINEISEADSAILIELDPLEVSSLVKNIIKVLYH